jgi:hypothetical protein
MEENILVAESALEELTQQEKSISSSNSKEVEEYYSKLHEIQQKVEQLYARWAELEDKTK